MYNNHKKHKKHNISKKKIKSELGLDPPTHFRVFLGFLNLTNPLRSYFPWCYILRFITVVIRKSCSPCVVHSLSTGFFLFCVRILNLKVQCNKYSTIIQCIQRGYRFQTSESDVIDVRFWRLKTTLVSYFSALTLSTLNLPLSSSCTTSRELLSQFSTSSG